MREMKQRKVYRIWNNSLSRFITTGSRIKTHWHTFKATQNAYKSYLNDNPNSDLIIKEYNLVFAKNIDIDERIL